MLNEQIIADNHALIARNRELECELEQLKAKLGRVRALADELHGDASELVERYGDEPLSTEDARTCSFMFRLSCKFREAVR